MQKKNGFIISTTLYALFGVMLLVIFYILYFLFSNKIVNNYSSKKLKEDVNITSVTNDNTTLSGIVLSKALNDDPNIRQFKKYNITEYYYQNYPFDNYVWYSGKLWRITKINSDGTVRLITEDSVYLSSFGVDFDKFYNTLRNPDFYLAKFKQCNDYISTANFDTLTDVYKDSNCPFTTYYPGYFNKNFQNNELWKCKNISSEYISVLELKEVLNAGYSNSCGNCSIVNEWSNECSEYGDNIDQSSCEMCEKNANKEYYINNYLINSTDFWTSTYQATDVRQYKDIYNDYSWHITSNGKVKYSKLFGNNIKDGSCWASETIQSIKSVRPVINIKQNILVANGDGTKNNPYRLESDYDTDVSGQKISDRYSGEYIKYSGYLWRISENGNYKYKDDTGLIQNISGTKIIIEDQILYSSANSYYGNITPVNMDNYILPNLNNYNNYLLTNVEWEARGASINSSATLEYSTLGIVHFRDLFAGSEINNIRQDYYLNDYVSDECDTRGAIRVDGTLSNSTWSVDPDNTRDIRMVAILKNDITIVSGTGTYDDPFIIEPTPKVNNTYSTNISDVVESVYMGYAPNNYLWYSGKLWRIIKKNSDNS